MAWSSGMVPDGDSLVLTVPPAAAAELLPGLTATIKGAIRSGQMAAREILG